jgi:hypothetical protein
MNEISPIIYIDLPKNELYYRLNTQKLESTSIFNKLKRELLPRMNFFIDGQRPNCPTWLDGDTFRQALAHISNQPIRVRPWFQSDSSGGQWLKTICKNLSQFSKNYTQSFEMISSENGIILSDINHHLVELSWEIFYNSQANRILGNDIHYRLFNKLNEFPIRFKFLDMMDGNDIRTNFGENITQDVAYYIIQTKQHWKKEYKKSSTYIYLGFHENVNPEEFHQALLSSREQKEELNIEKYLQCIPSNIHDFFLIPNETIHALGRNQVVLEISTTPYIDDHLQLFKNFKFNQHSEQFRCQPISIKSEENQYEEQQLPTHDFHIYEIHRLIIEANESIEIIRSTENRFHLCILVKGDAIEIEFNSIDNPQQKQIRQYNYIETFLIPASINEYRLRPIIKKKIKKKKSRQYILLSVSLKWDCVKKY